MPWNILWSALTSRAGLLALAFGAIVIFYEGLPLGPLRYVPYVGPALETITDGRVDKQRKAAELQERLLWEEARRKLLAQQAEARRLAQAEIDRLEKEYLVWLEEQRIHNGALEDIIRQLEAENAANPGNPRPVLPRRLSNELNKIGRR